MFILHSSNSQLVETYLNGSKTECGILEVEFDSEYWQRIIQRILKFIHYFNKFMKNEKLSLLAFAQCECCRRCFSFFCMQKAKNKSQGLY